MLRSNCFESGKDFIILEFLTICKQHFQYLWIVQFGSGVGILLNGFQFLKLFPEKIGLLIGLGNLMIDSLDQEFLLTFSRFISDRTKRSLELCILSKEEFSTSRIRLVSKFFPNRNFDC